MEWTVSFHRFAQVYNFSFWASCCNHCLATLDLGAGLEQPFDCLYRSEPSGHAVHEEVDGMDIGGQHGQWFVLLHHTHRPQRKPYPICTSRSGNAWYRCRGGLVSPWLFLGGSLQGDGCWCRGWKCRVLWGCPPTPHSIGDPPTGPHVCCCCQMNWWVVVLDGQVSAEWGRCPGSMAWHARDVGSICNKAQQVGCLRG